MTIKRQPAKKTANPRAAAKRALSPRETRTAPAPAATAKADERLMLPLRSLAPSKDNVRRFASEAGIEELCANIAALGLLQNLTGRKAAKGKYEIEAGARRLRALKELAKRGAVIEPEGVKVTLDYLVPVLVKGAEHNATELSLSENIIREDMLDHPSTNCLLAGLSGHTLQTSGQAFPQLLRGRRLTRRRHPKLVNGVRTSWGLHPCHVANGGARGEPFALT